MSPGAKRKGDDKSYEAVSEQLAQSQEEGGKMEKQRGSVEAIKKIIKLGKRISVDEMAEITDAVRGAGGALVSVEPDDDWCGNGVFHFRLPFPKPNEFVKVLEILVSKYINHEVLINGIPNPEIIQLRVSRQIGR
jgi:hypothetical protein